jgi:EAL and modified HD-GYP domain-containing signal transduction protein
MSTHVASATSLENDSANPPDSSPPAWAGEMRYVARQPILNLRGHVHGYELLFRNPPAEVLNEVSPRAASPAPTPGNVARRNASGREKGPAADLAARTMLDNAVMFGLDWLTNGMPAFVNCTAESLTENLVLVLSPQTTVLNLPPSLELTPRLLDACRKLKAGGYRLALDDFTWNPALRPLAALADYIRVNFTRFGAAERQYMLSLNCADSARIRLAMVAKNVNTQEDHVQAAAQGFTLFQGEYFCHPVLLKKRKVPANRQLHFEIVRMLHHDPIDVPQVSRLVMRDASLTYRLLRLVNSPLYAIYQEVRSVEAAIIAMGENTFRRVVSLAVLSEMSGDGPPEILHMALVRGRFCELAAPLCGLDPSEQYLLGMLSLVPAMLRLPMEELTPSLPLRAEICEALQGTLNPERAMLTWLECHERGDWETCDAILQANALRSEKVMRCYAESAVWAASSLRTAA